MIKVLLQTTIPYVEDDWHVGRFSRLREQMASMENVEVTARNREPEAGGDDPVLSTLGDSDYDQLWLIGVDGGDGIAPGDCAGISAFAQRGGGILATRDHNDCGSSICVLGGIGAAHFFHSRNVDPDPERRQRDDPYNTSIDWPNYHSGNNGDFQRITPFAMHPVMLRGDGSAIEWFPAHPHEGAVGAPSEEPDARVIAASRSKVTGRPFPLVVALEPRSGHGRGLAHSSFHHFCDYNWDVSAGCPSFVVEAPGDEWERAPERLRDIHTYVRNAVRWLLRSDSPK